jgi:hypothetical protein
VEYLLFEPPTSSEDSEDSDDQDYQPLQELPNYLIGTVKSLLEALLNLFLTAGFLCQTSL